jgi:hypothetical protein
MNAAPETQIQAVAAALGGLDADALRQVYAQAEVQLAGPAYLLWQTVTRQELESYRAGFDPAGCEEGRLFDAQGELHWRREDFPAGEDSESQVPAWRAVYVGLAAACPAALAGAASCQSRLDGQDAWYEGRIPRRLVYPVGPDARRVGMDLVEYWQAGRLEFYRLAGLRAW